MAARSGPVGWPGPAALERPPHRRPPSIDMREIASVLFPCGETVRGRGGSMKNWRADLRLAEPDQRKMPHRRHWPPLGEGNAAMFGGPIGQSVPREFRPPAEPPRQRRECQFEGAAWTALGADVIDQDQFAA